MSVINKTYFSDTTHTHTHAPTHIVSVYVCTFKIHIHKYTHIDRDIYNESCISLLFLAPTYLRASAWGLIALFCTSTVTGHSFIADIYIAPLQVGLLRSAPNPSTAT